MLASNVRIKNMKFHTLLNVCITQQKKSLFVTDYSMQKWLSLDFLSSSHRCRYASCVTHWFKLFFLKINGFLLFVKKITKRVFPHFNFLFITNIENIETNSQTSQFSFFLFEVVG